MLVESLSLQYPFELSGFFWCLTGSLLRLSFTIWLFVWDGSSLIAVFFTAWVLVECLVLNLLLISGLIAGKEVLWFLNCSIVSFKWYVDIVYLCVPTDGCFIWVPGFRYFYMCLVKEPPSRHAHAVVSLGVKRSRKKSKKEQCLLVLQSTKLAWW